MSRPLSIVASMLASAVLATAAQAEEVTFTDQSGREITLKQPVERVVTIPIPAASMFIALDGGTERLAGMHPLSKSALFEGMLGDFFPDANAVPSDVVGDGFMPNVEAPLAVRPDLVFQWAHRGSDIVDPLLTAGLNVATFQLRHRRARPGLDRHHGDRDRQDRKSGTAEGLARRGAGAS